MSIDATAAARVVGIETAYKDLSAGRVQFLPQQIAIIGFGNTGVSYPLAPFKPTSAQAAGARFGYGSTMHQAVRELLPLTGGGVGTIPIVCLPLAEDAGGTAAAGSITPSGAATVTATFWARIAGVLSAPITIVAGDNVAAQVAKFVTAIDAVLEMPVDAVNGTTDVDLVCKWKGATGNDLTVEVLDAQGNVPSSPGVTFTIVQPAAGAGDPDVGPALAMLGSTWLTMIVNALGPTNTTALGKISDAGEGRWGALARKPFVSFVGNPEPVLATAIATPNARTTDRVNVQVVAPGSPHLPVQIAAAHVREIAKVANNNPPTDYGGRILRNLIGGGDPDQWDYTERDAAVKAGSSTVEMADGLVRIGDVVTMYHPTGESPPAYRHVCDIVKLQTVIYNVDREFTKPEWNGAPLIPDGQPTANPNARTPSSAKAAMCAILDNLGLEAIISDPATAKKNTTATISASNPKRLDIQTTIQLSGNTNIISVDLFFGFFFGAPAVVA
jgi:phage tail sheath gpL-like